MDLTTLSPEIQALMQSKDVPAAAPQDYPGANYVMNIEAGGLWPNQGEVLSDSATVGASGYASNYRHAGNVALLKNEISNKIATDTGFNWLDKPTRVVGDVAGGIGGWGLGLGHELTADSDIFNKNLKNGIFNTQFLEDMAANTYGAIHGKTGITNTQVVNEMAKALATGDGPYIDYLNKLAYTHQMDDLEDQETFRDDMGIPKWRGMNMIRPGVMNQEGFRKRYINKYHESPFEKNKRRIDRKKEYKRESTPVYTGPVTHSFDPKQDTGRRPDKPGGFTDPGKGSYGPHMAYGGRASYFDGGLASLWPR